MSTEVNKDIPVNYDFGNLAVFDPNPLDRSKLESSDASERDAHIQAVTRDNVQLLVGQLLQLPVKKTVESINSSSKQDSTMTLFVLPEPSTQLPREKPLPKPKAPTKWELFAAKKGIQKKAKDGKLVFDEETGKWVPKWGYNGINKKLDNQWLVEVDDDKVKGKRKRQEGDELKDPRTLNRQDRKKLVKKNQLQQERNAKRAAK
ncbi:hypothetical protein D0Z00_001104 [Geotrichum galactomycetum]|uniref:Uncharacterized protein n=1 Tax=Geotrichum galactomycetum TaxID=27317 RepID=A0ACB6V7Y8_9ASCO|nr:hypothetical protein D0Z00_001104 [Geotrichum candidum]